MCATPHDSGVWLARVNDDHTVAGCRLRRGWDGASPVLNVPGDRELLDWVLWLGGAERRGVFVCQNHWRDAELGGRG